MIKIFTPLDKVKNDDNILSGYSQMFIDFAKFKLGYAYDDKEHDEEVLAWLTKGDKLSKSEHIK